MAYVIRPSSDELYHHGVKGQKWGVRHDPERAANVHKMKEAKKNYKAAKKAYNKSFNKWYYGHPKIHVTRKGRAKEQRQFMDALEKSNDLSVAKGEYMKAKGIAKNKPKLVAKGKYFVTAGRNNKAYNVKVTSLVDKGYSFNEAVTRNSDSYSRTVRRNQDAKAKYHRELDSIKRG